ncbi:hypothetical protein P5V12_12720 [Teredinibacter sp. KSP-S5-2]|nr:hypothetical protein [Teredinibacter sp. KSP-S5-2]WNO07847.1 hypothetical protein P5V12_12720 [Teredinibacter sp. KSP-S5-2]
MNQACRTGKLGRASYYRVPRDWRAVDAAVIDALNEQLQNSARARFWKCYKRIRLLTINELIVSIVEWG